MSSRYCNKCGRHHDLTTTCAAAVEMPDGSGAILPILESPYLAPDLEGSSDGGFDGFGGGGGADGAGAGDSF